MHGLHNELTPDVAATTWAGVQAAARSAALSAAKLVRHWSCSWLNWQWITATRDSSTAVMIKNFISSILADTCIVWWFGEHKTLISRAATAGLKLFLLLFYPIASHNHFLEEGTRIRFMNIFLEWWTCRMHCKNHFLEIRLITAAACMHAYACPMQKDYFRCFVIYSAQVIA